MTNEELLKIIEKAARDEARILDLSGKGLTTLPAEIGQLSNLIGLDLSKNQLTTLPAEIGQLSNLDWLLLSDNQLTTLPAEIGQLINLSKLILSNNQLTTLPAEISQLSNLSKLILSNNELTTLPAEIGQLINLSNNELTTLPVEIGQLSNLRELDLSNNKLTTLPVEIGQLSNLRELDLSNNKLTTLPAEIGQLINLIELELTNNELTTLPAEIGQLINLSGLYLSNNELTTLPAEIGQLINLSGLKLSNNQLTTLPVEISQLINLIGLHLSNNQLTTLQVEIGQLLKLMWLYLSNNELTTLPVEIGQLINLIELDLNNNLVMVLPSEIGQLIKLEELKLSNSRLETLPVETWKLTKLTVLDLRDGRIKMLPEGIEQLFELSRLNLRNNLLETLPKEIWQLTKLKRLDLRGNKLPIPPEILGSSDLRRNPGDPSTILNYFFQLQKQEKKPLNEAKMLLVGQGSVGKTSLVRRLINNRYNPHECKTEGINITNWQITVNEQLIRLNVWDFGGQEIMHATHQFFLTKRSLYLLVLDSRVDELQNKLEYWLKIIQSFSNDSPILIVGNKIDQHPLDIDQRGLCQKYPAIKGIMSISCQTGEGLEKLQLAITNQIANLDHIHDPLPQSWFQVKTRLEQMEKDYIPYSEYESLSQEEQVSDALSQATLIELLHQLGIILNFRDDPRLAEMGVLNPEWVTNGVYKILNDNRLMTEFRGILDRTQLNRILDNSRYPGNKPLFIIDMMRKFELCFPLEDGNSDRFLIPDLLPKEEPATGDWENGLAFQYHYSVLPNSIISRFIVRMHHNSDRQTWWRSGIVLKHLGNRALVKSDQEDRKIFITISGSSSTRRELLAMIRSQFDAIHQTIKGLLPEEKVPIPGHPNIVVDYKNLLVYEQKNLLIIPPGLIEPFNARQLLDGIELKEERQERQREHDQEENCMVTRPSTPEFEKEIFLSYAWRGESEQFVNKLDETFQAKGIKIIRDKRDLGYKGLIKAFMERIGRGKCAIAVISDKYLKSRNCMFELMQIAKNGEFYNRIFPIVLADAQIYKPVTRLKYIKHWEDEIKELDEEMKKVGAANLQGFREEIDQYTEIRNTIAELTNLLKDMNTLTPDIHSESDFESLLNAIAQRLDE
ncbi:leucine-rich repeat domain-containing protein [Nostoc sp.]|uniref:leucine-rich repeat domain-containing protein n=1 Tax=Nostoc sp. TaxID=1180 RepID=UPI002FFA705C